MSGKKELKDVHPESEDANTSSASIKSETAKISLPPRPKSPFSGSLQELKAAFPDADENTQRAVLVAAGGNMEQAFNGMLALTDKTIRPAPPVEVVRQKQSQYERDEALARQLASQYGRRPSQRQQSQQTRQRQRRFSDESDDELARPEPDFVDEVRENLQKGMDEASKKMTSFFGQLKDKFNAEFGDQQRYSDGMDDLYDARYRQQPQQQQQQSQRSNHYEPGYRRPQNTTSNSTSEAPDRYRKPQMADESAPIRPPRPSKDKPAFPNSVKPVNAFGEEKPSRWEPIKPAESNDAFFIGESDSDLESLTGDDKLDEAVKDDVKAKDVKVDADSKDAKVDVKDVKDAKVEAKAEDVKDAKDTKADTKDSNSKAK